MIGAKLKIALLYDVWTRIRFGGEKQMQSLCASSQESEKIKKEKTDREEISDALQKLGHEPSYFELDGRPQSLHSLSRCDPTSFSI